MSALNSVRHLVVLLLAGFVAYFSFSNGISLFSWHPPLMVIGFLLLMTEAIMVFSNDRAFTQKLDNKNRLDFHGLLQVTAGIFIGLGFLAIYYTKVQFDRPHYETTHGNIGYMACICSLGASTGGLLARYGGKLKLPVNLIKIVHATFGTLSYSLALSALCLGLNSPWFQQQVSETTIYGSLAVVVVIGLLTVYSPILTVLKRVKRLGSKAK